MIRERIVKIREKSSYSRINLEELDLLDFIVVARLVVQFEIWIL